LESNLVFQLTWITCWIFSSIWWNLQCCYWLIKRI